MKINTLFVGVILLLLLVSTAVGLFYQTADPPVTYVARRAGYAPGQRAIQV